MIELVHKEPEVVNDQKKSNQILYSNELSSTSGGARIFLEGIEGVVIKHSLCFDFQITNNQVEYEALITGLKLANDLSVKSLVARSDSQLVVSQVNKMYETKVPCLAKYLEKFKSLLESFDHVKCYACKMVY